jgi:putative zinc finger/helix-turn-helix YgiT family protein
MTKCVRCGASATRFRKGKRQQRYQIGETTFSTIVPMKECPVCGEGYVDGAEMKTAELAVAAEVARRGPAIGLSFRFMRSVLGIRGNEMAELLGVRPETISRWEKERGDVDRAAWALLGSMVIEAQEGGRALRDRLETLRHPARVPKDVRVE